MPCGVRAFAVFPTKRHTPTMTKRTNNRRNTSSGPAKANTPSIVRQTSTIVVIGGGATGYAAAIGLAASGQDVTLFAPPTRDHPARTAALLQSSVDILTDIGVWPQIRDIAEPLVRMRLIDGTRRLIRAPEVTFDAAEVDLPAFGYNIANSALVDAMANQARTIANLRVIEASAETVERSENGWRITWPQGETEASLLIGADGRKSLVGEAIGVTRKAWSYPQQALVAIIQCGELHQSTSSEFHCSHGPVTLVPLAGNQVSLVWVDQPARIAELLDQPDEKFAEILEERTASILGAMTVVGPRASFPLSGMRALSLTGPRAVLVGEAAHVLPPIGAQGLNLGIRDVAQICALVSACPDDPGGDGVLSAYQRQRQPDILSRSTAVDMLNRSLLTDFLPVQAARSLGLGLAGALQPFRKLLMKQGLASGSRP